MRGMNGRALVAGQGLVLAWVGVAASPSRAADTLESWSRGDFDLEAYVGLEGVGSRDDDPVLTNEYVVGHGLTDRLSVYGGSTLATPVNLAGRDVGVYAGAFGSLLDTDHVDVDLLLDVTAQGPGLSEVACLPLVELNLDLLPDRELLGLYAQLGLPLTTQTGSLGRTPPAVRTGRLVPDLQAWAPNAGSPSSSLTRGVLLPGLRAPPLSSGTGDSVIRHTAVEASVKVGAYWTVRPGHQLLAELDLVLPVVSTDPTASVEIGGLSLGYNAVVVGPLEAITQVTLDLPAAGESPALAFTTGFILGVPSPTW